MHRFDRSLVAPALFGLMATCFGLGVAINDWAASDALQIPQYRTAPLAQEAPADLAKGIPTSVVHKPCKAMVGTDESGLCAQWLSTRASETSAYWAKWSFWVGLAGLIGLFVSLSYTRKALNSATEASEESKKAILIAERNANAAAKQAEVAEDTAKRTLRAYLHVKYLHLSDVFAGNVNVAFKAVNYGETPAHKIRHYHAMDIFKTSEVYTYSQPLRAGSSGDAPIAKGQAYDGFIKIGSGQPGASDIVLRELFNRLNSGSHIMHLRGWIDYTDVFGHEHRSHYHVYLGGEYGAELQSIEGERGLCFSPCFWPDGNTAT